MSQGLVTVIIPHLNQPEALGDCLASLDAQSDVRSRIQVIVADNGSDQLPRAIVGDRPDIRLIQENTPGPGPARNAGVALANGDILAFIDADCTAAPGWLHAIESAFDDPSQAVIGGDVRVRYATPGHPTPLEPYEAIYSYRNHEHIAEGFSGTGNLAMRREIFDRVGPFGGIDVAEDRDWGLRARGLGIVTRYVPEMIIYHPARETFAELALKWDRHISHDYSRVRGYGDHARWFAKTLAMGASPLAEIPTVLRSPRVNGPRERWMAFACLARVRFYRMRRMGSLLLTGKGQNDAQSWNRS